MRHYPEFASILSQIFGKMNLQIQEKAYF